MGFLIILFLFIIWRGIDFLILFFVPKLIPYLGFFPYKEILPFYHLPDWVTKLANFDGTHYLLISQQGYMTYEQAYFPLYPVLIKLLTFATNNSFMSGFIISNVGFLLGLWMFYKYLKDIQILRNIDINRPSNILKSQFPNISISKYQWIIILLLLFPSSFFFGAIYTEGLFFFLFIGTLYFLKKKNYLFAGVFAFLASLTRLIGVFLIIPIFLSDIKILRYLDIRKYKTLISKYPNIIISNIRYLILLASPLLGILTYMLYLWITVKNPLYFLSSQPIFGAHRSTNLILLPQVYWRYFKIVFTATHDFRFYISMLEITIFTIVFIILILDLLNIFQINQQKSEEIRKSQKPENSDKSETNQSGLSDISGIRSIPTSLISADLSDRLALNFFSLANLLLPTLTGTFSSIPRYSLFSISFFIFLGSIKNNLLKISIVVLFVLYHIVMLAFFGQGYFVS